MLFFFLIFTVRCKVNAWRFFLSLTRHFT